MFLRLRVVFRGRNWRVSKTERVIMALPWPMSARDVSNFRLAVSNFRYAVEVPQAVSVLVTMAEFQTHSDLVKMAVTFVLSLHKVTSCFSF